MEAHSKTTTTTKVTQFNDNPDTRFDSGHIPADHPGPNVPPVSQDLRHMPSGGFHNEQELLMSEKMRHDPNLQKENAIPSPIVTQERLHQGEILRSQSKKLSEIPCDDQQLHMPGAQCQEMPAPPNGPEPTQSKPGLGTKIKGEIDKVVAWVNEKIHPVHPTKDAGIPQHYGIQPGQGLTQPVIRYTQYGPGVSDLPPQPINKIDNLSTQTQAGSSQGSIQPPTTGAPLTMKEKAEIASISGYPVDLGEMGLTNKPVVVKADLPLPPGGIVETKNPYTGMPEEFKQEYIAKSGAIQKEHITTAGKKGDDLTLGEKIKDTAAAGWEVAKEKASEAKEYLDENLTKENTEKALETIKEKTVEAKEWIGEKLETKGQEEKELSPGRNDDSPWEKIKETALETKTSLDRKMSKESRDMTNEELAELRAKYDEAKANLKKALKQEKSPAEKFSESKMSGWEKFKSASDRVTDMLEKKLAGGSEKTAKEREYEAAERTRESKVDWVQLSKKDRIKDSLFDKRYNDTTTGFLKKHDY